MEREIIREVIAVRENALERPYFGTRDSASKIRPENTPLTGPQVSFVNCFILERRRRQRRTFGRTRCDAFFSLKVPCIPRPL
jgi:hypothetical protein